MKPPISTVADPSGSIRPTVAFLDWRSASVLRTTSTSTADSGTSPPLATVTAKECVLAHSQEALETYSAASVIVADNCVVSGNTYGFFKNNNLGTCYTRGNNTFSLNTNNINSPNTTSSFGGY